jgi:hypothetical protein
MPADLMPQDARLILADAYSADIVRHAPEHRMAAATRRAARDQPRGERRLERRMLS